MNMKKLKNGSYSVVLGVVAVIVVLLVNMIAGKAPTTVTKLDVSEQKLFTIGEQTKEVVAGLDEDITIYVLSQETAEDITVKELLDRYESLSDRITVEVKDPVLYPEFSSQYTEKILSNNSLIIVGENHVKAIDYYDLYVFEMDYTTNSSVATKFDGEGQITSAIAYVTSQEVPVLYALTGHQEIEVSGSIKNSIEKENIEVKELNLLTAGSIPEDAGIIFIYAPLLDISAEETELLKAYLEQGGHMLWITAYTEDPTPNLDKLMEAYGIEKVDGVVLEQDANYYLPNYPNYLLPKIAVTEVTPSMSDRYVVAPMAQGLVELEDARETLEITKLLTTSSQAFSKQDISSTSVEMAENDVQGPFMIGVAVTETVEEAEDVETRLAVFSSEHLLVEDLDARVYGGNTQLIMDALGWMSDHEVTLSIAAKSLDTGYLTVPAGATVLWSALLVVLIPAAFLVCGGVVCYRRRKK